MNPPRLTRRLVLETHLLDSDGSGGFVDRWLPVGTLWADVRAGTGSEQAGPGVPIGRVAYRIVVRAAPPGSPARPRADQRLREGTRLFRILAVAEHDRSGGYLTCFAQEEEPA